MSGRLAASDSDAMRSMCSSSKAPTVGMNSIVVPGWSRTAPARVTSSSVVAERDGTGLPSPSLWVGARDDEKPSPPAASDSWRTRTMVRQLLLGRLRPDRRLAHHRPAHGRVTDEEAGVHHQPAVQPVQPVAVGAPVPVQAGLESLDRHPLDPCQHAHDVVGVLGRQRGDAEPAVAADDRGHPVERRRAGAGVPEELGVVVGVDVDEPGRHDQPGGVDGPSGGLVHVTDGGDPAVTDAHVGPPPGRARTVDHAGTGDLAVQHHGPPL